jgi:tetratricopeptide (TPR) repeat protein
MNTNSSNFAINKALSSMIIYRESWKIFSKYCGEETKGWIQCRTQDVFWMDAERMLDVIDLNRIGITLDVMKTCNVLGAYGQIHGIYADLGLFDEALRTIGEMIKFVDASDPTHVNCANVQNAAQHKALYERLRQEGLQSGRGPNTGPKDITVRPTPLSSNKQIAFDRIYKEALRIISKYCGQHKKGWEQCRTRQDLWMQRSRMMDALDYFRIAIEIDETNSQNRMKAHSEMHPIYADLGMFCEALEIVEAIEKSNYFSLNFQSKDAMAIAKDRYERLKSESSAAQARH